MISYMTQINDFNLGTIRARDLFVRVKTAPVSCSCQVHKPVHIIMI